MRAFERGKRTGARGLTARRHRCNPHLKVYKDLKTRTMPSQSLRGERLLPVDSGKRDAGSHRRSGRSVRVRRESVGRRFDETVATVVSRRVLVLSLPSGLAEEAIVLCPGAAKVRLAQHRQLVRELGGLASDRLHRPPDRVRHTIWRDAQYSPNQAVSCTHEQLAARAGTGAVANHSRYWRPQTPRTDRSAPIGTPNHCDRC
jgi:hypothetical protein